MCLEPGRLPNGQEIACRKCKQCRQLATLDWVGRLTAESKTARACHFLTLTYGNDTKLGAAGTDHERAAMLTYSDMQKFFKRLRKNGYPCRYFVVGEYGSAKGRAHWHVLIFWLDKRPKFTLGVRNSSDAFWPHGFYTADAVNAKSIRYVCKYMRKEFGHAEAAEDAQAFFMMSKKPPLGNAYFRGLALRHVEQSLAPRDLNYSFPEDVGTDGKPTRFRMSGVTAMNFIYEYLVQWAENRPNQHAPWSELVEEYSDKLLKEKDRLAFRKDIPDRKIDDDAFMEALAIELRYRRKAIDTGKPFLPAPGNAPYLWSETKQAWAATLESGETVYWSFNAEGDREWTGTIRSESASAVRRDSGPNKGQEYQNEYRRQSGNIREKPLHKAGGFKPFVYRRPRLG